MTRKTTPPQLSILSILAHCRKIWREVKRPFRQLFRLFLRKIAIVEKIKALHVIARKADSVFGVSSDTSKITNSLLRFNRWKFFVGGDVARFLRIPEPKNFCLAQYLGIDLEKEIQLTDKAWVLDGINLPHVLSEEKKRLCEYELRDIVLPSYLRHRSPECFDTYCDAFDNRLWDFGEGPYEYGNVCLNEGDVVFDCGANMGLFSAVASRYGAKVYAFEAIPDIIDNYLSKTADMNENIRIQNVAVWDKEEMLEFSLVPDNIGASRANQLHPHWNRNNFKQFTIPAITLDAFVERNGIKRVDFIKADIEGAERNMLRGATRILREFAPKLSICTYHLPDDPQVLREIILEANPQYKIVEKFNKMYAHVPQKASNARTQTPHSAQSFRKAS